MDDDNGASFDQFDFMNQFGRAAVQQVIQLLGRSRKPKRVPNFIDESLSWRSFLRKASLEAQLTGLKDIKDNEEAVRIFLNKLLLWRVPLQTQLFSLFTQEYEMLSRQGADEGKVDSSVRSLARNKVRLVRRTQLQNAELDLMDLAIDRGFSWSSALEKDTELSKLCGSDTKAMPKFYQRVVGSNERQDLGRTHIEVMLAQRRPNNRFACSGHAPCLFLVARACSPPHIHTHIHTLCF